MLLVIDIGNTNTSLGVFDGEALAAHWRLTTVRARTVDEWGVLARNLFALAELDFKVIDAIAVASVVPPLNFTLKRMADEGLITLPSRKGPLPRFEPIRIKGKPLSQTIIEDRDDRF